MRTLATFLTVVSITSTAQAVTMLGENPIPIQSMSSWATNAVDMGAFYIIQIPEEFIGDIVPESVQVFARADDGPYLPIPTELRNTHQFRGEGPLYIWTRADARGFEPPELDSQIWFEGPLGRDFGYARRPTLATVVPEPGSAVLALIAALAAGIKRRSSR